VSENVSMNNILKEKNKVKKLKEINWIKTCCFKYARKYALEKRLEEKLSAML
jgi:hypothetical protein